MSREIADTHPLLDHHERTFDRDHVAEFSGRPARRSDIEESLDDEQDAEHEGGPASRYRVPCDDYIRRSFERADWQLPLRLAA